MTKQEIISKLSEQIGCTKRDAGVALNGMIQIIKDELDSGHDFMIPDIGKLKIITRAAKTGRNPKTGEEIKIAEHKTVVFKPCKGMKDAVN